MGSVKIIAEGGQGAGKTLALDVVRKALEANGRPTQDLIATEHGLLVQVAPPLPAPALTEQSIVDALKADPAMAGRVVARFAYSTPQSSIAQTRDAASAWCDEKTDYPQRRSEALKFLAVALAAASYRG